MLSSFNAEVNLDFFCLKKNLNASAVDLLSIPLSFSLL